MSEWRRQASLQLPELQPIIASRWVDNPMMLWIELNMEFGRLCMQSEPPIALLGRIWKYGHWCLVARDDAVSNAAAVAFFEHAIDSDAKLAVLPWIASAAELSGLRPLLEYHHTADEVDKSLKSLWKKRNI